MKTLETLIIRDPRFMEWITMGVARGPLATPARHGTMIDLTATATEGVPDIDTDSDNNVVVRFMDVGIPEPVRSFFNILV